VREFCLGACDRTFAVRCHDDGTAALMTRVFAGLLVPQSACSAPVRTYDVAPCGAEGRFRISDGTNAVTATNAESLLFCVDKDMTLTLQRVRRDLFFLHAAAVAWNGRVAVVPAFAGTGKSTLTFALLENGFEYLSDELAPIDLNRLTVHPYPHALCLKSRPPKPFTLPDGAIELDGTFQLPVHEPTPIHRSPMPVAAIVFIGRSPDHAPGLHRVTTATATTRLMAHALNALAHSDYGLDAAISLGRAVPSFELDVTDLSAASAAIKAVLQDGHDFEPFTEEALPQT